MNPDVLARMRRAHAEALRLPPEAREGFLRTHFQDAPEIQDEVRNLVKAHEECGDFLSTPLAERIIGFAPAQKNLRIGPYELIEQLGRGGSSSVYRAQRSNDLSETKVAIKILNRLSHSAEVFSRFQRELQILARVDHPYIVRLVEAGTTGDAVAYIVTELIEGQHLDQFAAPLNLSEKLRLFTKVCDGVSAAHRNLVVHRDLKPSNILVKPDGTPKLLDFGIAFLLDDSSRLTETGLERMTIYYASPEQLRGETSITTASDVYSLGVLLHELISGSTPFNGPKHELATRIQSEEPPPLKNVPGELRAVVRKAMEKDPRRRYDSVDRFRDDLIRFLDGLPVSAHGDRVLYKIGKLARKYWIPVSATLLTIALLLALSIVSVASSREAKRQSTRVKELLSRSLNEVANDREHYTNLRVNRRVREVQLKFLDSLAQEYWNDFEIETLRFSALRELGNIEGLPSTLNLGETEQGRDNLQRSVRLGEQMITRWPQVTSLRNELALAYIELGSVLLEMNREDEARTEFDRAEVLSKSVPPESGTRPHLEVLAQQSRILSLRGRKPEALEIRRQVVERRRELSKTDPVGLRWEYPGALCSYGELLREMGRYSEAEEAYFVALPLIEDLTGKTPHGLDDTWHLARENEEYAKVLLALRRDTSARKHLQRAADLYNAILGEEPDAISNYRALAVCLNLLGSEMAKHGEQAGGLKLLYEALNLSARSVRLDPGSVRAKRELEGIRWAISAIRPVRSGR